MKNKLLNSSIFRFIERGIVVLTSLLLMPYFIKVLGSEQYGLWVLVLSIMGWFDVVSLGFPQAVQRQIIQALELKDNKRVNIVFSTGLVLFGSLGLASVLILIGLTQVPAIFGVEGVNQITLINILLILSVKILWGFMMNPFHGFFSGLLRFDIDANISSLNVILKALLVFWLISDFNIWGAVAATLLSDTLTNLLKVYYAKKLFPSLTFSTNLVSRKEILDLFSYSKHIVLNGIAVTIASKSGPLIITQLFDLHSVAVQRVATSLTMHLRAFIISVTGVFSPIFNQMAARKQNMEKVFIQTTTINMFVSTVLHLCLLMFGKVFILLWVGSEFEYSVFMLYAVIFSSLCSSLSNSTNSILLAQANHKLLSVVTITSVCINIPLSIFLGLKLGLIGVVLGAGITNTFFNIVVQMILFKHYNDYKVSGLYKQLFLALLLTYGLGFIGVYLLDWLKIDTWLELVISGTIAFPIIILICWVLLLNNELKAKLYDLIIGQLKSKKTA